MSEVEVKVRFRSQHGCVRMKDIIRRLEIAAACRLDFNENTFAARQGAGAARKNSRAELTKYPEREPLKGWQHCIFGLDPKQVLLTNGVDEPFMYSARRIYATVIRSAACAYLLDVEVYATGTDARVVQVQAGADFAFPLKAV